MKVRVNFYRDELKALLTLMLRCDFNTIENKYLRILLAGSFKKILIRFSSRIVQNDNRRLSVLFNESEAATFILSREMLSQQATCDYSKNILTMIYINVYKIIK